MTIGADRWMTFRNPANRGDLGGDFLARQYAAFTRLCALAQFDLEHANLLDSGQFLQALFTQVALKIPHTVFSCPYLKDQIAAAFEVIG